MVAMPAKSAWTIRVVDGHPKDRAFDRAFWRRAGAQARWAAAWQMIVDACALRGEDGDQLRLQRSLVSTRPASR
jgi:hypothetical protein